MAGWAADRRKRQRRHTAHGTGTTAKRFASVSAGNVSQDAKPDTRQTIGARLPDRQWRRQQHTANHGGKCPQRRKLGFVRLCIFGRLWSSMDKGANRFGGASRFSARRGFTVRSAYAKAADHPGRGLTAGFSRVYTQLRRSCYLCARVVPQKNFFESPFRGIHSARKTCILPKQPKKCAMLLASAGQAAHRQNHCRRWTTCGRTTA